MAIIKEEPIEWHNAYTHSVESSPTLARRIGDFPLSGFEEEDESHASAPDPPEDLLLSPSDSSLDDC